MHGLTVLGLVGSAVFVAAHPHDNGRSVQRRTVDLNSFRLPVTTEYVNATVVEENPPVTVAKRADYISTATDLVKKVAPNSEFRVADSYVGTNGVSHVYFKQTIHGLDLDNADFNVNIGADGMVFSFGNNFYTGAIPEENPTRKRDFKDPVVALSEVSGTLQLGVDAQAATAEQKNNEVYTLKGTSGAEKDPEARLVYFVKSDGALALTWRVETDILDNWLLSYVDASSADIHGVIDWVAQATYKVYPWGVNDPTEGDRVVVSDPWDITASEFGWNSDGTSYTVTRGNNGIAQSNPSGRTSYLSNYRPDGGNSLKFEYDYTPSMSPPSSYIDASVTQLFYTANKYHDLLYQLGFTEAAGNFEYNNNGNGGRGSDFVILNAQDGSSTNNADFATPSDGSPGRMRMYIWTFSTPYRDCAFEAGVVIHEYTHGLSNRLTGGPSNSNCLNALESGGMGEGWGDFMATAIRLKPGDTRNTDYSLGAWVYNKPAGVRSHLYSTSLTTNPYTYTTANSLNEVHAIGEIWANVLYEVMWNLIDKYGKNDSDKPQFSSSGVPTDGKYLAMKLVVDAMALQPCNPNMVQARDAIIDADKALTGGVNQCELWTAFAKRGLGSGAQYSSRRRTGSNTIPAGVC